MEARRVPGFVLTATLLALLVPDAASAGPPSVESIPPPPVSASPVPGAPTPPLPPGITAGPSRQVTPVAKGTPNSKRWVRASVSFTKAGKWLTDLDLTWSCESAGTMKLYVRDRGRWVFHLSHHYRSGSGFIMRWQGQRNGSHIRHVRGHGCDDSRTAEISAQFVRYRAMIRLRTHNALKVRATFREKGVKSTRFMTLRRTRKAHGKAHAAAYNYWKEGDAICWRSATGGNAGQVVIDVDPSATFGARIGDTVFWETWMYVWDESRPAGQRGFWVEAQNGWFSYTVNLGYAASGAVTGGEGNWGMYVGGTSPGGISGNQTWNIPYGLWVLPAIAVQHALGSDWNWAWVRETNESGIYQHPWCHFS
jgi:hypothetical protein